MRDSWHELDKENFLHAICHIDDAMVLSQEIGVLKDLPV